MSDRNRSGQVAEMGVYLGIVFEFIGMLGFSGFVGYALQRWVWPEQGALAFLFAMMAGLAIGIYHIMQRVKDLERRSKDRDKESEKRRPTVDDSHKALDELRQMNDRLDEIKRKKP